MAEHRALWSSAFYQLIALNNFHEVGRFFLNKWVKEVSFFWGGVATNADYCQWKPHKKFYLFNFTHLYFSVLKNIVEQTCGGS